MCIFLRSCFTRFQIRYFIYWIKWKHSIRWHVAKSLNAYNTSLTLLADVSHNPSFFAFHYRSIIICIFYIFVSSFDIYFFFFICHFCPSTPDFCVLLPIVFMSCSMWLIIHLILVLFHKCLSHDFIKFLSSKTVSILSKQMLRTHTINIKNLYMMY